MVSRVNIVDLESTCWDNRKDQGASEVSEIIEIGIVQLDTLTLSEVKRKSFIIKPKHSKISEFCTKLTTLTQDFIDQNGENPETAYIKLRKEFDTLDIPWLSWGDYDRKMFDRMSKLYSIKNPMSSNHLNLKLLDHVKNRTVKPRGMDTTFLFLLDRKLYGTHHRGLDDAINITELAKELLFKG